MVKKKSQNRVRQLFFIRPITKSTNVIQKLDALFYNSVIVILRLAISSHVCINCICRTQSFLNACMEGKYSHFFFLCGIIVSKKGIEAKKEENIRYV